MGKVWLFVGVVFSFCVLSFVGFSAEANAAEMHRLYNPNSGEHFYTADTNEKNHLVKVGWYSEGIGWNAPASGDVVYRLYNPNAGDHHYTLHAGEKNHLVKVGWEYEGIGWYSDVNKAIPLYRTYNPNAKAGSHNYTVSYGEQKNLIKVGWRDEGIAWYGVDRTAEELKIMQKTIVLKVNELRKSKGLKPLQEHNGLNKGAAIRAQELIKKFEHTRPNGNSPFTVIKEQGVSYSWAGENIALISGGAISGKTLGEQIFMYWQNSSRHYANMIKPSCQYIGVGVSINGNTVYGVQLFTGN